MKNKCVNSNLKTFQGYHYFFSPKSKVNSRRVLELEDSET